MEIPHVKGSHPLVFHGAEPAFYLGFGRGRIGTAVVYDGADACGQQLHLAVLIGAAIVENHSHTA